MGESDTRPSCALLVPPMSEIGPSRPCLKNSCPQCPESGKTRTDVNDPKRKLQLSMKNRSRRSSSRDAKALIARQTPPRQRNRLARPLSRSIIAPDGVRRSFEDGPGADLRRKKPARGPASTPLWKLQGRPSGSCAQFAPCPG